jgi:hypothetical protein
MEATHPLATSATVTSTAAHPLVLAAAASVTVLSLTGVAYLAGWLPGPDPPDESRHGRASACRRKPDDNAANRDPADRHPAPGKTQGCRNQTG